MIEKGKKELHRLQIAWIMKHRAPTGSSPVIRKNKGHDINIKKEN